ncbi:HK97 gp10 family phage protein [Halomonas alimentaria]|uniref:HK97 gp10 family phage protein n=1 Tax=Halomonas alimentaria TaxID=147248 RepID=A0A7X5AQ24_9GAMM|nr:HK97 gp10 family phage protein [Halomonas alimentaria]NAW34999.1 HK97 gp10 family phage protein [Halomonas alimentaria]
MSKWNGRPTDFLDEIEQDLTERQKDMASFALGRIISASPVDTGAYRQSHTVSIDSEDHSTTASTEAEGKATIASLNVPYSTVYIQSNSPYGERLEHGHSQQAPAGVYGNAALATKERFTR